CRLRPHAPRGIERLAAAPGELSVAALLDLGARRLGAPAEGLSVLGRAFTSDGRCGSCGAGAAGLRLAPPPGARCRRCGGLRRPPGFGLREGLSPAELSACRRRSLASLGVRAGDVAGVWAYGGAAWLELAGGAA
ncbi:MAG TPA: hypothetical protein VMT16_14395, partial [Thermoanaerobaculia bacterium]|nr:hypothetical protein [Thermoanaerobaculia bacterium]